MNKLQAGALALAKASDGNPVLSTITVVLFWLMFSTAEAMVEKLIFGERFEHWLDPIFASCFIAYAAYAVWWCAAWNGAKQHKSD